MSRQLFEIMFLLPLVGSAGYFLKRDVSSRALSIVISTAMIFLSVIVSRFPCQISLGQFEFAVLKMSFAPLLLISVGLLLGSLVPYVLASSKKSPATSPAVRKSESMMKGDRALLFLGSIALIAGYFSANAVTFASAWMASILLLSGALGFSNTYRAILVVVSALFLASSAVTTPVSVDLDPIIFVARIVPLFIGAAVSPFNVWHSDLLRNKGAYAVAAALFCLPVFGAFKFGAQAFPVGAALFWIPVCLACTISALLPIFFIEDDGLALASVTRSLAFALAVLPPLNFELAMFAVLATQLSAAAIIVGAAGTSAIKRFMLLGLPGAASFPAVLASVFWLAQAHPPAGASAAIAIMCLAARRQKPVEPAQSVTGLDIARKIIFWMSVLLGLYPMPWMKLWN